jgi:Zn finger protein HypA/HybF involved in hydrogenase expression
MAIRWLLNYKEPSGQIARWLERLSRRPHRQHHHGDCPTCGPTGVKKGPELHVHAIQQKKGNKNIVPQFEWSPEEIRSAQQDDLDLKAICQHFAQNVADPPEQLLQGCSSLERAVWAQHQQLKMKEGILYISLDQGRPRLVLPKSFIQAALAEVHEGFGGAHLGIRKTYSKLRFRCWRQSMKRNLIDFIRTCESCQKSKSVGKRF